MSIRVFSRARIIIKFGENPLLFCNRCSLHSAVSGTRTHTIQRSTYHFLNVTRRQSTSKSGASEGTGKTQTKWQKALRLKPVDIEVKRNIEKVFGGKREDAFKGEELIVNLRKHSNSLPLLIFVLSFMWIAGSYTAVYCVIFFIQSLSYMDDLKKQTNRYVDYKLNPQYKGKTFEEVPDQTHSERMSSLTEYMVNEKDKESVVKDKELRALSEKAGLQYDSHSKEDTKAVSQELPAEPNTSTATEGYFQMLQQWSKTSPQPKDETQN